MAKRKYEILYKIRDRRSGKYTALTETMPQKEIVEAESETNAIAKLKDSLAYKLASATQEWEIFKITPK